MSDLFDGVSTLSRPQLQQLCDFPLPLQPRWQLGAYTPPGPVGAAYIDSMGPIDAIMGPGGSGKTVASIWKGLKFVLNHMPVCRDGVIRAKGTVIRDNYRSLYRTTLQSWFDVFPTNLHPGFSGGQDRPAVHQLRLATVRNIGGVHREVPVDLRMEFFAVADVNYELLFKSYETTFAWATEADGIDPLAISFFYGRTARYPRRDILPPGADLPRVAFVDFNPPDPEHPLYLACLRGSFKSDKEFNPAKDEKVITFFRQPSGLSDQAENRTGKPLKAYQEEMAVLTTDQARRMVEGRPGRVKSGLPVYDEDFDYDANVAALPLEVIPQWPLHMGIDQGGAGGSAGSPAAALFQVAPSGQVRVYAEVAADPGTGVQRFLEQLIPLLTTRFAGLPPGNFTCDPSGFFGGDTVYGSLAFAEIVSKALGHRIDPAPTNEFTPRRESLALVFGRNVAVGTPKITIDRRCSVLIRGLTGGYKYGKRHDGTFDTHPVKNLESNVVEALQYGVLGVFGLAGTISRLAQGSRPGNVRSIRNGTGMPVAKGFSVWDT